GRAGAMPGVLVRRAPGRPWSRVVLATDLSSASAHAARTALGLCPEAELFLLHAVDVPLDRDFAFASISAQARESFLHETRVQAANRLELFEQALGAQGRSITRAPREGRPQAVLAAFVAEVSADLVVVGARPRARWEANLLGGTAYHAVNRLGCDVLLVPEPGERPLAKEDGWGDWAWPEGQGRGRRRGPGRRQCSGWQAGLAGGGCAVGRGRRAQALDAEEGVVADGRHLRGAGPGRVGQVQGGEMAGAGHHLAALAGRQAPVVLRVEGDADGPLPGLEVLQAQARVPQGRGERLAGAGHFAARLPPAAAVAPAQGHLGHRALAQLGLVAGFQVDRRRQAQRI